MALLLGLLIPSCNEGSVCPAGTQCAFGACQPCLRGQYCPTGTTNANADWSVNVCPAGSFCSDPSNRTTCPSGYACASGTYQLVPCSNVSLTSSLVQLVLDFSSPWCMGSLCSAGSSAPAACPEGFYCQDSTHARACAVGHYCPEGSTHPMPCSSTILEGAHSRCPARSSSEPRSWQGLLIAILAIWVPIVSACHLLHIYVDVVRPRRRVWRCAMPVGTQGGEKYSLRRTSESSTARLDHGLTQTSTMVTRNTDASEAADYFSNRNSENFSNRHSNNLAMLKNDTAAFFLSPSTPSRSPSVRDDAGSRSQSEPQTPLQRLRALVPKSKSEIRPPLDNFIHIQWSDLDFRIGRAPVLRGMHGQLFHGDMVSLLGESGSGKTTLLNVLAGRAHYGTLTGDLRINHRLYEPHKLQHLIGYVMQHPSIFEELTVYENLLFAGLLRAPRSLSHDELDLRVQGILSVLGLLKCCDFVVDSRLGAGRLSGGQVRRLGIGVELMTEPAILLLDEPTSALDIVNSRIVVNVLKQLSELGMAVLASLHQPNLATYHAFNKSMFLHQGRLVYGGACNGPDVKFLHSLGYHLPRAANPADFFIEVCFGFERSALGEVEALHKVWLRRYKQQLEDEQAARQRLCANDGELAGVTLKQFMDWVSTHPHHRWLAPTFIEQMYESLLTTAGKLPTWVDLLHAIDHQQLPASNIPGPARQILLLLVRYALKSLRLRRRNCASLLLASLLSFVAGLVNGPTLVHNPIYLIISMALFAILTSTTSIDTLRQGAHGELFMHEASGGVRLSAVILSLFVGDLLLWLPLTPMFCLPFAGLINFPAPTIYLIIILFFLAWAIAPISYVVYVANHESQRAEWHMVQIRQQCGLSSPVVWSNRDEKRCVIKARTKHCGEEDALHEHEGRAGERAALENRILRRGMLAGSSTWTTQARVTTELLQYELIGQEERLREHMRFCASSSHEFSHADDVEPFDWFRECMMSLFLIGIVFRFVTVVLFVHKYSAYKQSRLVACQGVAWKQVDVLLRHMKNISKKISETAGSGTSMRMRLRWHRPPLEPKSLATC